MTLRYTCSTRSFFGMVLFTIMLLAPDAFAQQTSGDPPSLFRDAGATRQALKAQGTERLQTIEAVPTTASIRLVRIADNLSQQVVLTMQLDAKRGLAPDIQTVFQSEDPEQDSFSGEGAVELFIRRDDVEIVSDDIYAWDGTIVGGPGNSVEVGEAHFIYHKGGHVSGSIRIKDEFYKVYPLENGLSALVEINESKMPRGGTSPLYNGGGPSAAPPASLTRPRSAATPEEASLQKTCSATDDFTATGTGLPTMTAAEAATSQAPSSAATSCGGSTKIDMLIVYTAGAAQGRDINNLIATVIQEANRSYDNSAINGLDLRLAHSQQVSFDPGDGLPDDDIDRLRNDSQIQSLRNQYDADVVILLTGDVYGIQTPNGEINITGAVEEILAEAPDAYGVVEAPFADAPDYTFAHEVGHVQGGQHHPDDIDFNDPDYNPEGDYLPNSFGHRFRDRDCSWIFFCHYDYYATVMAYPFDRFNQDRDYANIEHFSNPNERFDSQRTGTSARNNASALRTTASTVASFRQGTPDLVASIDMTGDPRTAERTFTADPCGGTGGYSYEWRISYNDPDNYGSIISTQPSFTRTFPDGTHFVKLTVYDGAGQVATAVQFVYIADEGGCLLPPCELSADGSASANAETASAATLPETFALHAPYPNPFQASSEIAFDLPERAEVRLAVYDVLGREMALLVNETRPAGVHHARFNAAGLTSGVYVVRFTAGAYVKTQRLVLVR